MCLKHPGLETGKQHLRTWKWKSTEFYLKEHQSMGEIDAHVQQPASPTPEAHLGTLGKEEEATNTFSGNDCTKGIDF